MPNKIETCIYEALDCCALSSRVKTSVLEDDTMILRGKDLHG